jgi:hypothetical protein
MYLIAQSNEPPWWVWLVGLGVFVFLAASALLILRAYEALARRALRRIYSDFDLSDSRRAGDIAIVFHTYHGLIAWFTQTEHRLCVPGTDAKRLLNRFLRFNLTWGLFTWGALFVPPISLFNYLAQRRSIAQQLGDFPDPPTSTAR